MHLLQAIAAFQKDPPTTVFLLSMRSGSVGINLTSANYVFILEPALNPALEEQAIGRAWRMGQQREVRVKKLYVEVRPAAALHSLHHCSASLHSDRWASKGKSMSRSCMLRSGLHFH